MARRSRRTPVVPGAGRSLEQFKVAVMQQEGYAIPSSNPNDVKFAVAQSLGIPLTDGGNGQLSTRHAGQIGGQIGGAMVREMIRMAQRSLISRQG